MTDEELAMSGPPTTKNVETRAGRLAVRTHGAPGGEPLLFVHGLIVDGRLWDGVVGRLEGSHRCIVPDLPLGSHRAAMRTGADLTPPALADLLVEVLDATGHERATLVGSDTGGAIAQIAAARHPDRFGRLILAPCDTHENFLPPAFRPAQWAARVPGAIGLAMQATRLRAARLSPLAYGALVKRRPQPDDLYASWTRPAREDRAVLRDLVAVLRGIDTRHLMAATEALTRRPPEALLVWTREDRFFTPAEAERLAGEIGAELRWIDDAKTFIPLDQPQELADEIARFCTRPATVAGSA